MSDNFVNYVLYPVIVIAAGGIGKVFILDRIVNYFNNLDSTLVELNKTIHLLILDQTQKHGEQDKRMDMTDEAISTVKVIQRQHTKNIDELYDITEMHKIDIELLKMGKEDK